MLWAKPSLGTNYTAQMFMFVFWQLFFRSMDTNILANFYQSSVQGGFSVSNRFFLQYLHVHCNRCEAMIEMLCF